MSIKELAWRASQNDFFDSHKEGNRFHFNIIQRLLPKGYISTKSFRTRGKMENGQIDSLMHICSKSKNNLAVIGDGGIGKTTFLQQLLTNEFQTPEQEPKQYEAGNQIPFFIELNRCPEHIGEWYEMSRKKTNFITRYIGQLIENKSTPDDVSLELLEMLENEFRQEPESGVPQYLLLLDGFNEVRIGYKYSIRTFLSNEISELHKYPNIRIITTSRETQAAYYAADFENVRLIGVEEADIVEHLTACKFADVQIAKIMSCPSLAECLKIPLNLCMFSAENAEDGFLPETAGEIFYAFFHRKSAFYNTRQHAEDTKTNPLDSLQTALVLDFVLPYIGWQFERQEFFSLDENLFKDYTAEALDDVQKIYIDSVVIPFQDFDRNNQILSDTLLTLRKSDGRWETDKIVDCIHGYLGIVYRYEIKEEYSKKHCYAFGHHQFRDYFSAIWDVQLLNMLQCTYVSKDSVQNENIRRMFSFINANYWQAHKAELISQILMEHRNKPVFDKTKKNWDLPKPVYEEQQVLSYALDFCRRLEAVGIKYHYLLRNILSAISYGREEYSGMNLSGLDFKYCSLFNVTCSKPGKTRFLAADFADSHLYEDNFVPGGHQDNVIEYIYQENHCFTIDNAGEIRCWDVPSGKLEYKLQSGDPGGLYDFSSKGYMKISKDGRWLAAKVQNSTKDGMDIFVNLFDLQKPDENPEKIYPQHHYKVMTEFAFTNDSKGILLLCDYRTLYCVSVLTNTLCYQQVFDCLMKYNQIYAADCESSVIAFSAEYNEYDTEWEEESEEEWDEEEYDEEDLENEIPVPCAVFRLDIRTSKAKELYSLTGMPHTTPTAEYFPEEDVFLLYNHENRGMELFSCITGESILLFEELILENEMPPSAIHQHPVYPQECYIVYPDNCYVADIHAVNGNGIVMRYSTKGLTKLLNSSQEGEFDFKPHVVPSNHRFIVGNDTNTYEWDTENETLQLKYNTAYYGCSAFMLDSKQKIGMLVHQYNGISIFSGNPPRLIRSFCFAERDFYIGTACYAKSRQLLALVFVRQDHERVVLLNIETGEQKLVFATMKKDETIESLCFNQAETSLLFSSQYQCVEYKIRGGEPQSVKQAAEDERLGGCAYVGKEIEIAVIYEGEETESNKPEEHTRCEYYKRPRRKDETFYSRTHFYIIPELPPKYYHQFFYQNMDLGVEGSHDSRGIQKYWITKGFFLECTEELKNALNLQNIKPLEEIYIRHSSALNRQQQDRENGNTYTYLSDDGREVIFLQDSAKIYYCEDITECKMEDIEGGFIRESDSYGAYAYWDFIIPWNDKTLLGCFENYRVIIIDSESKELGEEVEYMPGISICGCSFENISADPETKQIILRNGGKL